MKYRIKVVHFPMAASFWIAQYRIWGIWLNIANDHGYFTAWCLRTWCDTLEEAQERIYRHKSNAKRAKEWGNRETKICRNMY